MRRRLILALGIAGLTAAGVIAPLVAVRWHTLPPLIHAPSPLEGEGWVKGWPLHLGWSTVGDALASHCVRDDGSDRLDLDVIAKCVRVNARGVGATGFDPTPLLRHEHENFQFSNVISGAVTNNPFGRVIDFDISTVFDSVTRNGLEPDRGVFLTDSCVQGMVVPFQSAIRGRNSLISGGDVCIGVGAALVSNTAGTFIRDHRISVGDLLSFTDDPFNQQPSVVLGASDATHHTVMNFFIWNRPGEVRATRSELKGSFFLNNDCDRPDPTAIQSLVACNDVNVQQATAQAGGVELEAGTAACCSIVTVAVRWRIGGDLRSVDQTPPPGNVTTNRQLVDQGVFILETGGTFLMNGGTVDPLNGLFSTATYLTGRIQTPLGADSVLTVLPTLDISPGEPTAILTSISSP